MFTWKWLNFSFIFGEFSWMQNSWLTIFFFQYFEDAIPLSSGLHSLWWKAIDFSFAALKTFSLPFTFISFTIICLSVDLFDYYTWVHWASWMCRFIFFIKFGKFLAISSSIFPLLYSVLTFFSFWDSHYTYVGMLDGIPQVS